MGQGLGGQAGLFAAEGVERPVGSAALGAIGVGPIGGRGAGAEQVDEGHREEVTRPSARRPATIRAATRTASIRLDVSARPCQAMSNAVPCATLVRTIGRPSVTLTAWLNPIVFNATWPWS